ncbi:MAG: FHA domain-containing protein [Ignavibacteriae bacterium]|nr:FHA domain-containing protein [Ignavibacteriota bacterium]
MSAQLFSRTGQLAGASFAITDEARIGKAADNSIVLYPEIISSRHARIWYDKAAGAYFIEDLSSRNGTRIDGMRVTRPTRLDSPCIVTFANVFDFVFLVHDGEVPVRQKQPTAPRAKEVASAQAKSTPAHSASAQAKSTPAQSASAQPRPSPAPSVAQPAPMAAQSERGKTEFSDDAFIAPAIGSAAPAPERAKTEFSDDAGMMPALGSNPLTPERGRTEFSDDAGMLPALGSNPAPPEKGVTEFSDAAASIPSLVPSSTAAPDVVYQLRVNVPGATPRVFTLLEGENTIGREDGCSIVLNEASMSRRHAAIVIRGGAAALRDLGSKNGTMIGDRRITGEQQLRAGDTLRFGSATAVFDRVAS